CMRETVHRIGVLSPAPPSQDGFEEFVKPLRDLGWIVGKNIAVEQRYADWHGDRLGPLAEELARLDVELIISRGTAATIAAKKITTTIPIVMSSAADPVAMGIVASLSRPRGNVTGYATMEPELITKRAGVIHEILPAAKRIALLVPELAEGVSSPTNAFLYQQTDIVYRSLGVEPIHVNVARPYGSREVESAVAEAARLRVNAVELPGGGSREGIEAANALRLPAIVRTRQLLEAGALMYLHFNRDGRARRVAAIVDKILRGARPADIAVEQPTKFTLGINVKAANALGIAIPQAVVMRADEVIR